MGKKVPFEARVPRPTPWLNHTLSRALRFLAVGWYTFAVMVLTSYILLM